MASFTLSWRDALGTVTPLDGSTGILVTRGPVGLDLPTPQLTVDDYVAFDGGALVNRRHGPRTIAFPIYARHSTRVQTLVAQLATMFAAPGSLIRTDTNGDVRTLRSVVYEAGLSGDLSTPASPNWRRMGPAQFTVLDPWWYGDSVTQVLPLSSATAFNAAIPFNSAIPFNGGASVSVTNPGSTGVDAHPVITVVGPASEVTISCNGSSWQTAAALTSSDVLVVDSRPGTRGPSLNGGGIDWSLLTQASRVWTLPAGTVPIVVGAVGSSGATSVTMAWESRYATP